MNKIGIIVEGESDKEILKVIIGKIDDVNKVKENFIRFSIAGSKTKLFKELEQLHINELVR